LVEAQRHITETLEEELEQGEWEVLVSSPGSKAFLKRLFAGAEGGATDVGGWDRQ